jgi:hypothetical protein
MKTANATLRWDRREGEVRTLARLEVAGQAPREVTWRFTGEILPRPTDRLDLAAVAFLPVAMNERLELRLRGRVSRGLLESLEECVDAWGRWRPDLFGPARLEADEEADDVLPRGRSAVMAFSGGVDSTHALATHRLGLGGRRGLDLRGAVLVHGFDVPLKRPEWFERAVPHVRAIAASYGVPLVLCETNWRTVAVDWEMGHAFGLAATLHHFAGVVDRAMWAADEPYEIEVHPWGSNSVTNHLLSGPSFPISNTGAAASRSEKLALVAELPAVREHVRVCWVKPESGLNCGRCEKCLRTWLAFMAAGHGDVPALGTAPSVAEVASIRISNPIQWNLLYDVLAKGERLPPDYRAAVQAVLDAHPEHRPGAGGAAPPPRKRRSRWALPWRARR